jgi:transcriptional regulator GlxA family with amidase domain
MVADFSIGAVRRPNRLLDKLDAVVEQHFTSRDFDLAMMADAIGMSERQLQRKLKKLTGCTPSAYVRRFRLNKSLEHLKTGQTVWRTAIAVGFSSQSYFASCFHAEFGMTPSKYQQDTE